MLGRFIILLFFTSCVLPPTLSSQVIVAMSEPGFSYPPIAHHKGQEDAECRRGIPENHVLPWDENRDNNNSNDNSEEDRITTTVSDYWFKVIPSIANRTPYVLVITDIVFSIRAGREQSVEKSFSSYCDTSPLYILDSGEEVNYSQSGLLFTKGNLVFYVDGLPSDEGQNVVREATQKIQQIPNYSVQWKMIGYFADADGTRHGGFQQIGQFLARPERF